MKNDIHIALMKKVNAKIIAINEKLDELYAKHKAASEYNNKEAA